MAISRITTWNAGDSLLASDLNAEFDNLADQVADVDAAATITGTWTFSTNPVLNNNAVGWAKVDKTGSSLADLITRSAGDLSSGSLPLARIAPGTNGQVLKAVSGATAWDTGVRLLVGPFSATTLSAGATERADNDGAGNSSAVIGWLAAQAGSITGISYAMNPDGAGSYANTISAGQLELRVRKNFTEVWSAATLTSGSATTGAASQAVGSDTFAAGDEIDLVAVTDGSYAESSAVVVYTYIEVSL